MPKETFFNLPDEKRLLIETIAIGEFASNGFDKASINTIVSKAGIAKGSFYQYFVDKKDLYIYLLMTVASAKKIQYMTPVLQNPKGHDFFTLIRELFISGLSFAAENPELDKLGMWLVKNSHHPIYIELFGEAGSLSTSIYEDLLTQAQARGELKEGIDCHYISHVFQALLLSTMDYCLKTYSRPELEGISDIRGEILKTADVMIDLIKDGIGTSHIRRTI